jgi:hypothetical protein
MFFGEVGFAVTMGLLLLLGLYRLTPAGRRDATTKRVAKLEAERSEARARRAADKASRAEGAARSARRDSDAQDEPYTYHVGRHANEALAIRYGIANLQRKVEEYWYIAQGGVRTRNPERDRTRMVPGSKVRLQKVESLGESKFRVLLSDHRDREAIAIIERGSEIVKTFYPLDERWFEDNQDLELTLKGNGSFGLKELAVFHVQKAVLAADTGRSASVHRPKLARRLPVPRSSP